MAGSPVATFESMIRVESLKIYRYSLTSVAANTVGDECLIEIPRKGAIRGFGIVSPTSLDLDITVYQASGNYVKDSDVLLSVIGISDGQYKELFSPPIPFYNNDSPIMSQLWLLIRNADKVHATGVMEVEVIVQHEAYVQSGSPESAY